MAGAYAFQIFNGEDFDKVLTWSQTKTPVSQGGPPVNLTGYSATMTIASITDFITDVSSDNGLITLGGVLGTIRLYIPAAIAAQFLNSAVLYRLFVAAPGGDKVCIMADTFQVLP